MIQINLIEIVNWLKKYSGWIVSAILLFLMFNCNPQNSHAEIIKERDNQNNIYQKTIDSLFEVNKSKDKLITKSEKNVTEKEQKIKSLNDKIVSLEKTKSKQLAKIKNYGLSDWKKYYQERTGYGKKEISVDGNSVKMTREPLVSIGKELIQADVVKAELTIVKNILTQTQGIVVEKDKIIQIGNEKIVNLQEVINSKTNIEKNLVKNISDLKTDLKKANRPKAKVIIISALLGGLAGAIIAK